LRWLKWPIASLVTVIVVYQAYLFMSVAWLAYNNPATTAFITAEKDRLAQQRSNKKIRQTWVAYSSISPNLKRAVLAAEDSGFAEHDGVEWEAIEKAALENLEKGKIKRGGSTITMQLAKNLFLSPDRSLLRKGQELVITFMLEAVLEKRRILEIYLNVAEWGEGVFGIEAAARHYYGVSAKQLSAEQSAWLASILPAPKRFDKNRDSAFIRSKAEVIQARMPQVALP
jgi:monofunctional biosynthetic peptidoglycan transglycosylase